MRTFAPWRHIARTITAIAAVSVATTALPSSAAAQVEAGQVIDDSTHAPLVDMIVSLHRLDGGAWKLVDSAKTDTRGLFQFRPTAPGIFRVGVLGTAQPRFVGRADTLAADSVNERMFAVPMLRSMRAGTYLEFEVQKPAAMADPSRTPEYPPSLRSNPLVPGEVDAQFVVNTDGSVDMRTFKVLRSTAPEFAESVRKFLITAHYLPAEVAGRVVRQVVQQKFVFG